MHGASLIRGENMATQMYRIIAISKISLSTYSAFSFSISHSLGMTFPWQPISFHDNPYLLVMPKIIIQVKSRDINKIVVFITVSQLNDSFIPTQTRQKWMACYLTKACTISSLLMRWVVFPTRVMSELRLFDQSFSTSLGSLLSLKLTKPAGRSIRANIVFLVTSCDKNSSHSYRVHYKNGHVYSKLGSHDQCHSYTDGEWEEFRQSLHPDSCVELGYHPKVLKIQAEVGSSEPIPASFQN